MSSLFAIRFYTLGLFLQKRFTSRPCRLERRSCSSLFYLSYDSVPNVDTIIRVRSLPIKFQALQYLIDNTHTGLVQVILFVSGAVIVIV